MGTRARVVVLPQKQAPLRIEEITLPDPGPTQVIVRQFASGICHSQLHQMHRPRETPVILGHEATGIIEKAGSQVRHVARRRSGAGDLGAARRGAREEPAGARDARRLRRRRAVGERVHVGRLHAVRTNSTWSKPTRARRATSPRSSAAR